MTPHRRKLWRSYQAADTVRYRSADYRCADCHRWHTVVGVRRYVHYDERNETLEDMVLDALRTSGTHGCQHKKAKQVQDGTPQEDANE